MLLPEVKITFPVKFAEFKSYGFEALGNPVTANSTGELAAPLEINLIVPVSAKDGVANNWVRSTSATSKEVFFTIKNHFNPESAIPLTKCF